MNLSLILNQSILAWDSLVISGALSSYEALIDFNLFSSS